MKKKILIAFMLSMIGLYANTFAQTKPDTLIEQPHFGLLLNLVTTSLNYGKTNGALADHKRSIFGGQLGLSFQTGITSKISLVSEFYFLMKGGKLKADYTSDIQNTTLRLYTLELPILARYYFGDFYINAGPSIACNFYGNSKAEGISTDLSFNSSDGFKRWDAGIQTGAGYTFHVKREIVGLDVRYSYGLTNISYRQETYNRYLNISLHFSKAR